MENLDSVYDDEFYKGQMQASYESAKAMLGVLKGYFGDVSSVMDVGCGVGTWLKAWQDVAVESSLDSNMAVESSVESTLESGVLLGNKEINGGEGGESPLDSKNNSTITQVQQSHLDSIKSTNANLDASTFSQHDDYPICHTDTQHSDVLSSHTESLQGDSFTHNSESLQGSIPPRHDLPLQSKGEASIPSTLDSKDLQNLDSKNSKNTESTPKIYGIDGNDADKSLFFIPIESYKRVDLTQDYKQILSQIKQAFGKDKFDLVESLEVAEHLHAEFADNFVALLTSLSEVILFSAAVPKQGGTNHFNEQPPAYWAHKFARHNFVCFDIREILWENENIEFWYRQNVLIFAHKDRANALIQKGLKPINSPMHIIHPFIFEYYTDLINEYERRIKTFQYHERRTLRYYLRHPKKILNLFKINSKNT